MLPGCFANCSRKKQRRLPDGCCPNSPAGHKGHSREEHRCLQPCHQPIVTTHRCASNCWIVLEQDGFEYLNELLISSGQGFFLGELLLLSTMTKWPAVRCCHRLLESTRGRSQFRRRCACLLQHEERPTLRKRGEERLSLKLDQASPEGERASSLI